MFDHCIYFNTMALSRQLDRIWTEAFKPFDLTPAQAFTLRATLNKPGMLQSELAQTLHIARATATRAIDGLEKRGLLLRRASRNDKRECEIHPTVEALKLQALLDEASAAMSSHLRSELGDRFFSDFVDHAKCISKQIS